MGSTLTSYDDVPYFDSPYPASHPDHLATVAALAGLGTEPIEKCRVLEVGCARGGNLIPMACELPGSRFVGVDSSPRQIREARERASLLRLDNLTAEAKSLLEIGEEDGLFDYIICHGIYSWVDEEVRGKILDVFRRHLAPSGVAFVSYNTYPGWYVRGIVRDLMGFEVPDTGRPPERAERARSLLEFVAKGSGRFDPHYGSLLEAEAEYLRRKPDSYLLHDHLEAVNAPVYFRDFVDRAGASRLQYVSEVQDSLVAPEAIPAEIAEDMRLRSPDRIAYEQLADFLINRKFRQSVLCHEGRPLRGSPRHEDLARLSVGARRSHVPESVSFRNPRLLKSALATLARSWPLPVPFGSVIGSTRPDDGPPPDRTASGPSRDAEELGEDLHLCYRLKLVEFHVRQPEFVTRASERPVASRLARLQAASGPVVTNLRHEAGQLGGLSREVLLHLDGDHDRSALLRVLHRALEEGRVAPDPAPGRDLERSLESGLESLARFALLVA